MASINNFFSLCFCFNQHFLFNPHWRNTRSFCRQKLAAFLQHEIEIFNYFSISLISHSLVLQWYSSTFWKVSNKFPATNMNICSQMKNILVDMTLALIPRQRAPSELHLRHKQIVFQPPASSQLHPSRHFHPRGDEWGLKGPWHNVMRTTAANGLRELDVPSGDLVCFTSLLLVRSRAVVQKSRCYITHVSFLLLSKLSFFDFASQRSGSLLIASVTVVGRLLGSTQLYTKHTELQWQSSPGASLRLIQQHKAIHQAKWLKRSSQYHSRVLQQHVWHRRRRRCCRGWLGDPLEPWQSET